MPSGSTLRTEALTKSYGRRTVVRGVSLDVASGEIVGLLGPNGAGKTTTVEILEGLLEPDAGSVEVLGMSWRRDAAALRERLGVQLQETRLSEKLTVAETVRLFRSFYRRGRSVEDVLATVQLEEKRRSWVSRLSGGQKQRLAVACALVGDPELLFLDEPTTGLDPQARMAVWDLIDGLRADGLGVVLTTHYMDEAERLSDVLTVLAAGRVVSHGTPKGVLGDLVGEHVVVVDVDAAASAGIAAWLAARDLGAPAGVLREWHLPLRADDLADFARAFPRLRYEVRAPTLDDLFLKPAYNQLGHRPPPRYQ